MVRKPTVPMAALKAAGKDAATPAVLPVKVPWRSVPGVEKIESGPPPAGWQAADFDDADWPRGQGPFGMNVQTGLLCLRGRFRVSDPATVTGLTFSMTCRGGAIVYLNGTEVARHHMPEGDVAPTTPAEAYPDEAFVGADGKVLPTPRHAKGDDLTRIRTRDRVLASVALPAAALRKGVNVLAVEVHRSEYHPIALTWWATTDYAYGRGFHWTPIGVSEISLTAEGAGVEPNILRPDGVQVWRADIHERVSLDDFGDPQESVRPLSIVGGRNGLYAASLVVSSADALSDVAVGVGRLENGEGAKIPASAIGVTYVAEGKPETHLPGFFDGLPEGRPGDRKPARRMDYRLDRRRRDLGIPTPRLGANQPVWLTVRVPKDAKPGTYRGEVTISAAGVEQPIVVPLTMEVFDWAVPDPQDFRTHVGIFQSPTTLAKFYNVPEWSDEHWKLMDRSLDLLGRVGNTLVNIPVSDQTQFGNDEGMVYLTRDADGGFGYDFTVFDRYVDLVLKRMGRPDFVALHVWHAGAWRSRKADQKNTLTVIDPKTGKKEPMQVPVFGTDGSKAFWKPLLAAIHERLAKRGLADSMCIGILSDGTAPPEVFGMFDSIWPGGGPARWTRGCHSVTRAPAPYALKGGGRVVYHEYCYGGGIIDPDARLPRIWSVTGPGTDWRRGYRDFDPPVTFRRMPERSLYAETRGIGRLGLDYWNLATRSASGRVTRSDLFNRWPHSSVAGHGHPTIFALAHPGPDGPVSTQRLELLREGLQEAEAMIVVAEAVHEHADALGPELVAECRRLFRTRIDTCRMIEAVHPDFHAGWQTRSRRLYDLAARVTGRRLAVQSAGR